MCTPVALMDRADLWRPPLTVTRIRVSCCGGYFCYSGQKAKMLHPAVPTAQCTACTRGGLAVWCEWLPGSMTKHVELPIGSLLHCRHILQAMDRAAAVALVLAQAALVGASLVHQRRVAMPSGVQVRIYFCHLAAPPSRETLNPKF